MRSLIMLVVALTVAATVGTVVVGSRSFEGIVVDKPYEAGLAWDQTRRNKEALGWTVTLSGSPFRTGGNELLIHVADKNKAPLPNATASVTISRPATRQNDKTYPSIRKSDGLYHAGVQFPLYGIWEVTVEVANGADHATFTNTIFAEETAR